MHLDRVIEVVLVTVVMVVVDVVVVVETAKKSLGARLGSPSKSSPSSEDAS